MKKILTLIATMLVIVGCGDSASNKTFEGQILVSQTYTLYPGDSVVKDSENALISITHKEGEAESLVTLIEGNVTILRQP